MNKIKKYHDQFSQLSELEGKRFLCISAHEFHSLVLTKEGEIYGWGSVDNGKLLIDPKFALNKNYKEL